MHALSVEHIARACGGQLGGMQATSEWPTGVSTDSRTTRPGDVFFAISGDRFDGHDFLETAIGNGAVAVVVDPRRVRQLPQCPRVEVADVRKALGQLAANYRLRFPIPMVAVAGSNGKTTTKDLLVSVLNPTLPTLGSEASFNNDVGVPLTLLRLEDFHRAGVVEVGTNHPGELEPLLRIVQPSIGVLTSLGREHLEFFGSMDGVVQEEGMIAECLGQDGVLVLPGDSEYSDRVVARASARVLRVGFGPGCDWRLRYLGSTDSKTLFELIAPDPRYSGAYEVGVLGKHMAVNAGYAIAVAAELGMSPGEVRAGLERARPANRRMQVHRVGELWVLDDSYNANPDSMQAALEILSEFPSPGRKWAILGEMAELGPHAAEAHAEVGRAAGKLGIDGIVGVGPHGELLAVSAAGAGVGSTAHFPVPDQALLNLQGNLRSGDVLLVKGSRVAKLDRVVDWLIRSPGN